MKIFILILSLVFTSSLWAGGLKVGDILLQPLDCMSCDLIEAQERTIYSHVGLVIETSPKVFVAEALGRVRILSIEEFVKRTEKGQKISVRRFQNSQVINHILKNRKSFQSFYLEHFDGRTYDHAFLWNNFDQNGEEKYYCSEFIAKLFYRFMGLELPVKKMKFDVNRDKWLQIFKGNPPDGQWGNSPGDFERSHLLYEVGEL